MFFDNRIVQQASALASQHFEQTRHLPAFDQKCALLETFDSSIDTILLIVTLGELDRLSGARQLPPLEVLDLMTHCLPIAERALASATIACHGEHCIQFAIWYARHGARIFCSAHNDLVSKLAHITGANIVPFQDSADLPENTLHLAFFNTSTGEQVEPFLRYFLKNDSYSGVIMTNWSFLSTNSPRIMQIKQRLIESGRLLSATQLPEGIMPRTLPALLQLGQHTTTAMPAKGVHLINARDWLSIDSYGTPDVSYLHPILVQMGCLDAAALPASTPFPPTEHVSSAQLMARNGDLRLHKPPHIPTTPLQRMEPLGSCASLVRGQMLAKSKTPQSAHRLHEVTLADIDELGFVTQASRIVDNAAPLPRARRLALLRSGDILIVCKGSLLSLGKVGLITKSGSDWLPNQTFYLIRSEQLDPLWLFYYLRSAQAQAYFKIRSTGTSVPQIQISDIAAMDIPLPTEEDLLRVHKMHANIMKIRQKIDTYRKIAKNTIEEFTVSM